MVSPVPIVMTLNPMVWSFLRSKISRPLSVSYD